MVKTIFDNSTSINPYFSIIIPMFKVTPMNDPVTKYLDFIFRITRYDKWYFGHWHQDKEYGNFRCLYNDIRRIE